MSEATLTATRLQPDGSLLPASRRTSPQPASLDADHGEEIGRARRREKRLRATVALGRILDTRYLYPCQHERKMMRRATRKRPRSEQISAPGTRRSSRVGLSRQPSHQFRYGPCSSRTLCRLWRDECPATSTPPPPRQLGSPPPHGEPPTLRPTHPERRPVPAARG